MAFLFLVIIYMSFISLGLPDSLLGVAWPLMQIEFKAPLETAGLISMVITAGTIFSSFFSGRVIKYLGTGKVTFISCIMTAGALLGFSLVPSIYWFFALAIPLGLGAGSVDAALNNYVANHYKAHHMSWLHCFWGLGATLGPMIMSFFITSHNSWRNGYLTVSIIQFVLVFLLLITLPLWDHMAKIHNNVKNDGEESPEASAGHQTKKVNAFHIKGVKFSLLTFMFYCAVEATMGLWGSSFLTNVKGINAATAAQWVSLYFGGITIGRFISGFITMKVSNRMLIRCGQLTALAGILLIMAPLADIFALAGFILIGLGCAPIFPCMIHETPVRFGKENSQTIIGYQMSFAYTGTTFLSPLFGSIAANTTIAIFPYIVLMYIVVMLFCSEKINLLMKKRNTVALKDIDIAS